MLTSLRIVMRAARQWGANGDSRLGAALAYYALFSIAPLLVIAINVTGVVYGEDAARGEVKRYLSTFIAPEAAGSIEKLVESAGATGRVTWAPFVTIPVLLYGALGAFVHLRTSLCLIWKLEPPHPNTVIATLFDYGLALLMVLCTAVLLLGSVAASIVIFTLQDYMREYLPDHAVPWRWVDFGVSTLFLGLLFVAIYSVLSGRRIPWGYIGYGAGIAALLFTVGKFLLGYYLYYAALESVYGAAGSLVVFLVWVYYSSQTLFFGAELIQARRTRREWLPKRAEK
jgi:membrane protein